MFGFPKKNKLSEEEKYALSLPRTKKVQFNAMPLTRVENELNTDITAVLSYIPANYYASKDNYLQCVFYFTEDYSEVFMQFENRVDDQLKGKTKLWKIDKVLLRDILRKFGQQIQI
ncbi:MAG: hypothetical protein J6C38_07795 [Oscillospiraceae bacterium]|nr:hypothetical protein [Oscillospiraceae bacterium]